MKDVYVKSVYIMFAIALSVLSVVALFFSRQLGSFFDVFPAPLIFLSFIAIGLVVSTLLFGLKTFRSKKLKEKYKGSIGALSVSLVLLVIVLALSSSYFQSASIRAPSEEGLFSSGFFTVRIYDTRSEKFEQGRIALYLASNPRLSYAIPVIDTDSVYKIEDLCLATILSINGKFNSCLPDSVEIKGSSDQNAPYVNVIFARSLIDRELVNVELTAVNYISKSSGTYIFNEGEIYKLEVSYTISFPSPSSTYGHNSFTVPSFTPPLALRNNVTGYGLWLRVHGSKIAENEALVNDLPCEIYYVPDWGDEIVLLKPVTSPSENQTISIKFESECSRLSLFEGFLDDYETTYHILTG